MCGQNGPGPARAWAALTFKHSAHTLHLSFTEFKVVDANVHNKNSCELLKDM